jgi:hypothetical protein
MRLRWQAAVRAIHSKRFESKETVFLNCLSFNINGTNLVTSFHHPPGVDRVESIISSHSFIGIIQ